MTMTIIIDMTENGMAGMIIQIQEEAGKEDEQLQVKVQQMARTMNIGPKVCTAKLTENYQENLEYNGIDDYSLENQFSIQSIWLLSEQLKKKPFAEQIIPLLTSTKEAVFHGQVQNQQTKKQISQLQMFEQRSNYLHSWRIMNN
ncbi:MAG: hypothetical protein EZS28_052173 [Streblomastix strix]|uniref:Uncharacterized protein n=1 Tax=Streblomastix strix TaxID=222440 RepID=A0A5J4SJ89_9EUKA|nr:MAG: hypothetical protein EZS28_052173 [Streblomastix strix]